MSSKEFDFSIPRDQFPTLTLPLTLELMCVAARTVEHQVVHLANLWVRETLPADSVRVTIEANGTILVRVSEDSDGPIIASAQLQHQDSVSAESTLNLANESLDHLSASPGAKIQSLAAHGDLEVDKLYCLHPRYLTQAIANIHFEPSVEKPCLFAKSITLLVFGESPTEMTVIPTPDEERLSLHLSGSGRSILILEEMRRGQAPIDHGTSLTALQDLLAEIVPDLHPHKDDNLIQLGVSSLDLTRFHNLLLDRLRSAPSLRNFIRNPTLNAIASYYAHPSSEILRRPWPPLPAQVDHQRWPLTPAQEQIWLHQQIHPLDASFNLALRFRLAQQPDERSLQRALLHLIDRYPLLRSPIVVDQSGVAMQQTVDLKECKSTLTLVDDLDKLAIAETTAFDLDKAPLLRLTLTSPPLQPCQLSIVVSHLVADEANMSDLLVELGELYQAELDQRPTDLRRAPIPLSSAAWWYHSEDVRNLLSASTAAATAHCLQATPTCLNVHGAEAPQDQSQVRTANIAFSDRDTQKVWASARQHSLSLYCAMLSSYGLLLRWYLGHDPLIQLIASARPTQWTEECVGLFANPLLFSCPTDKADTSIELFLAFADALADALDTQYAPYQDVLQALRSDSKEAVPPTNVGLLFRDRSIAPLKLNGQVAEPLVSRMDFAPPGTTRIPIQLVLDASGPQLSCQLIYELDAMSDRAASQFLAAYHSLILSLTSDPHQLISQARASLEIQFPHMSSCLVGPSRTLQPHDFAVQRVSSLATSTPDATAIQDVHGETSYHELWKRVERISGALRHVCKPNSVVAVNVPRSGELVSAILGALHAGCVFLPVDWSQPTNRLNHILHSSGAAAILTTRLASKVTEDFALPQICLDDLSSLNADPPSPLPEGGYMMFTSGSTGAPKGVRVTQSNLANFLLAMERVLDPKSSVTWLAMTALTFDMSLPELLYPLVSGGKVVMGPELAGGMVDLDAVFALARTTQVDHFQSTPSVISLLLSHPLGSEFIARLKTLVLGGEAVPIELARQLRSIFAGSFINGYGPTETTVYSSSWNIPQDVSCIRIGAPLTNTTLRVCTESGESLPIGAAGELRISGAGVSLGYPALPALTTERFARADDGQIEYRTGDLVRIDEQGELQWLGRIDRQFKLHGRRIEPSEIEFVLEQHPEVRKAAVLMTAKSSNLHISAFVQTRDHATEDSPQPDNAIATELRTLCERSLPKYLIPSAIECVDVFPLRTSGKIDYDKLAARSPHATMTTSIVRRRPSPGVETEVATLVGQVLGIESVFADDDFLELGGTSLAALRMASLAHARGLQLTAYAIFQYRTVERIAKEGLSSVPDNPVLKRIARLD